MWVKAMTNLYDRDEIRLIEAMPERDTIHYVYNRLMIYAGRTNDCGLIYFREGMPYTEEMLSTIFNRPLSSIRLALKSLINVGLIEIYNNGYIKIISWENDQNVDALERAKEKNRERVARFREKKKKQEEVIVEDFSCNDDVMECNVTVMPKNKKEEEKEDKKIERVDKENLSQNSVDILTHYEKITGRVGIFNLPALNSAISIHGEDNVRHAIDKAIEVNKINMRYVNGILKNWAKEGYKKGEGENGSITNSKNNEQNKFAKFKRQGTVGICESNSEHETKDLI